MWRMGDIRLATLASFVKNMLAFIDLKKVPRDGKRRRRW
jgi:hypothetical protein